MCRRWSAGPFLALDCGDALKIDDASSSASIVRRNGPSAASARPAAPPLFYRLVGKNLHFVSAEAFDDRSGYAFTSQIFIDEKPAYYDFANKTHNMTGAEVFAAFAPPKANNELNRALNENGQRGDSGSTGQHGRLARSPA